ncbi:CD27 antigen-like isoform X2 [Mixophyes fleayi]|uniref:CD27 antigen-like isoform X2 n=1 Tax=Mixophyes fleayi TaxID=3061075 RepID=UPI003F4DE8B5
MMLLLICLCFLLLGTTWGNTHQIAAADKQVPCNNTHYKPEGVDRCCSRCPPGFFLKQDCTDTSDAQCQPCRNGTFATTWNYAKKCRTCYPCSSWLVMKHPCSATQALVCVCPDGYHCTIYNAVNACMNCERIFPEPTETPPTMNNGFLSTDFPLWIIITAALLIFAFLIVVGCHYRKCIVKKIGRTLKLKTHLESKPEPETAGSTITGVVHGSPAEPLLEESQTVVMPMQEVGKYLSYPIQETDSSQTGECTLGITP